MKTKRIQTIAIFFAFGVVAGFLSLVIMSVLPTKISSNETVFSISLLAIIEELVKIFLLHFIHSTHTLERFRKISRFIFFPLAFGFGFSFFELGMIYFQQSYLPVEAFYPTIIHITSAILLTFGLSLLYKQKNKFLVATPILLAVFIHICYNVTIVKII